MLVPDQGRAGGVMYAARLAIVLLIILAVIVAYNPQAREQAVKTWESIRPVVVETTNSLYAAIRNLLTRTPSKDGTEEKPAPGSGGNFERIVTMDNTSFVFWKFMIETKWGALILSVQLSYEKLNQSGITLPQPDKNALT